MALLEKGQHGYYIRWTTDKEIGFLENIIYDGVHIGIFLDCKTNRRGEESTEEVHG